MDRVRPSLSLFNDFALCQGAGRVAVPPRVQRLVALVALRTRVSRRHAGDILWPGVPPIRADARLRSALWWLGRSGERVVRTSHGPLLLADDVDVDVRGWVALALRILDVPESASRLEPAALRPPGELLPGWCDDWVLLERERLRQLRLHLLETVAGRLLAEGRHAVALGFARQALDMEPARESAHRLAVRIHLDAGDVGEAWRQFRRCERALAGIPGLRPSKALVELLRGSAADGVDRVDGQPDPAVEGGGGGQA